MTLDHLAKQFRSLGARYMPTVMKGAASAGERARAYLVQESQRKKIVDRGGYVRSWKSLVQTNKLEIYNQAPYSAVIELGRRPNQKPPPYRVLIPWVRRHITIEHTFKGGARKGQTVRRKPSADKAVGIAIAIAKAIGKRGQYYDNPSRPGKRVLTDATDKITQFILLEVRDALQRAMGAV
jgi:hypothetical protein